MSQPPADADFDREILDYWIPRLVADGIDANDARTARTQIKSWADWSGVWSGIAETYQSLAAARLAADAQLTAGEALVRSSLCYHVAQLVPTRTPELKAGLQQRKVERFREAAPLIDPPAKRLEFRHGNSLFPGYLRLPAGVGPHACAILVPGLDSTKEDFITVSDMCVRRGLATFAFDGPGQGEARSHSVLAPGYEGCIGDVFELMAARDEIDGSRIGLLGRSLGGHYILRAAAADDRIAACTVFGGAYDLSDWDNMPQTILDGFRHATGSATADEARNRMEASSLDDCIDRVGCPTLIVHGRRDAIFHWTQAERIAGALKCNPTLLMDEDGVHCCHNHAFEYRTAMADWLAQIL